MGTRRQRYLLDADDLILDSFYTQTNANNAIRGLSRGNVALSPNVGGTGAIPANYTDGQLLYWSTNLGRIASSGMTLAQLTDYNNLTNKPLAASAKLYHDPVPLITVSSSVTSWTNIDLSGYKSALGITTNYAQLAAILHVSTKIFVADGGSGGTTQLAVSGRNSGTAAAARNVMAESTGHGSMDRNLAEMRVPLNSVNGVYYQFLITGDGSIMEGKISLVGFEVILSAS